MAGYRVGEAYSMRAYILALRSWMLVVDIMSGCVWIVRTGINSKAGTRIGCLLM
jgi:hypothetical protein